MCDDLEYGLDGAFPDIVLIAILALTTKVRILHVRFDRRQNVIDSCDYCPDYEEYVQSLFWSDPGPGTSECAYPDLHKVTFEGPWPVPGYDCLPATSISTVRIFLRTPKLKSLALSGTISRVLPVKVNTWDPLEASSSIEKIKLDSIDINALTLDQLMRTCKV